MTTPRQPDIWRNSDGHVTQQHNSLDAKPTTTGELGHRIDDRKRWGDPNDPDFGDVHFYDYEMDCEDAEAYPRWGAAHAKYAHLLDRGAAVGESILTNENVLLIAWKMSSPIVTQYAYAA